MPPTLLFASQNKNKVIEIQSALGDSYRILSLDDVGFTGQLEEPFDTFEANARHKAFQGYTIFNLPCFAEDAGLSIDALNGRPGVRSARYAGEQNNADDNIRKVLHELAGVVDRRAHFVAVMAYYDGVNFNLFSGEIHGTICREPRGKDGFGYDPIFVPEGYDKSFGELPLTVKKNISHRSLALKGLTEWLVHSQR